MPPPLCHLGRLVAFGLIVVSNLRAATPEGVAPSDWVAIRSAHEQARHAISLRDDGTTGARNPGQRWDVVFDGRGFTVNPDHNRWSWGLELSGYQERSPSICREGSKLSYVWDEVLTEWFLNDSRGLEQGWTFSRRPGGKRGPLEVTLEVRGKLLPVVSPDGRGVGFHDASGSPALHYGGLKAWDADGKELPASFEPVAGARVRIHVDDRRARYPVTIDPVAQQVYLKASNTGSYDNFGNSVAISGNTVVVGAPGESSDATGVNGNAFNNFKLNSGAAYVFVRNGESWTQQAYLKASNTGAQDQFGWAVAVHGDTIVVGALLEDSDATGVNGNGASEAAANSGAAYVFVRAGNTWTQQAYLKASNAKAAHLFGSAVAVSGETIVVGANREASQATGVNGNGADSMASGSGAAYVFVRDAGVWSQQAYLKASDTAAGAEFGSAVGISEDSVAIGAPLAQAYAGAVYAFVRGGTLWTQQARLTASNAAPNARFGHSVAISGDTLAVGARGESSAATGVGGNQSDTSAADAGAVYVFTRSGGAWAQQAYVKASNTGAADYFGKSVALDGDHLVVGAYGEDSAATGIDGLEGGNSAVSAGAAYVFIRDAGIWSQLAYLKASNTDAGDWFGGAVAVSGSHVFAGACRESGGSTGINGLQANNGAPQSGAVYGFTLPPPISAEIAVEENGGAELVDGSGVVAFAPSATGAVMTRCFVVKNSGQEPLVVSDLVLGGTNPERFTVDASGMPASLPGGSQGILRIHFSAATDGDYTATLQILSNDADESPFDVELSASAQDPVSLFNGWAAAAGLGAGVNGPDDKPFGDGVENLLKYASNLDGSGPDMRYLGTGAGLPVFSLVGSGSQRILRVEYLRRKGSGMTYMPKVSANLDAGTFVPMTGTVTVTDLDGQWERVRVDQARDLATIPMGFGIVKVTMP